MASTQEQSRRATRLQFMRRCCWHRMAVLRQHEQARSDTAAGLWHGPTDTCRCVSIPTGRWKNHGRQATEIEGIVVWRAALKMQLFLCPPGHHLGLCLPANVVLFCIQMQVQNDRDDIFMLVLRHRSPDQYCLLIVVAVCLLRFALCQ